MKEELKPHIRNLNLNIHNQNGLEKVT